MMHLLLVGLAAGAASALLLASFIVRSPAALLVIMLAPLPLLIAAMGWGFIAGLVAAIAAGVALGAGLYVRYAIALSDAVHVTITFLVVVGLPTWWLGYLALEGRPGAQPDEVEWYPAGWLVVWSAALAAAVVSLWVLNISTDAEAFRVALRRVFEQFLRAQTRTPADAPLQLPGIPDTNWFIDLLVAMVPPTMALFAMLTILFNLWLAGTIVRVSGRLPRPWPDLNDMRFPPRAAAGFAAAIAASFVPGIIGLIAGLFATTLLMGFALLGLAIVHKLTTGMNGRGLMLSGLYLAVVILGWPVLMLAVLGLIDSPFDIRQRVANWRGPPAPPAPT